ncbi:MAG: hypothetical protein ACSHXF_06995 [Aquaticitalea sp.]
MTKAHTIFLFLFISCLSLFAQNSINDYKYVIVPNQFEFLKESDQYQINSLTKFLFNKYGYIAYMQNEELPEDLRRNGCLGLICDVVKESGFLKTKLRIDLKDCKGNVVQSSRIGESREKEFAKAYNLALRDAFETFQNMSYSYQPNQTIIAKAQPETISAETNEKQAEIARLKEEIKNLKEEKVEVVEDKISGVESKEVEKLITTKVDTNEVKSKVLYAQAIDNGYQLVDSTPKVVMILRASGVKDVYKVEGKEAIVFKKGEEWLFSESGDIFKGELINIKF